MAKRTKKVSKEVEGSKNVMLFDPSNCACIVAVDDDGYLHQDYKLNLRDKKQTKLDYSEIKMDINQEKFYLKDSMYSVNFLDWFIKILRAFHKRPKLSVEDLDYVYYEKDFPCLIYYDRVGMILAPRIEND